MKLLVWIVLYGLTTLVTAHAAGFDCGKADSKIEHIICDDAQLSKLDEELNAIYIQAIKRNDVQKSAIESQKQWLKFERNICQNAECLKMAYDTRIKELGLTQHFGITFLRDPASKSTTQKPTEKLDAIPVVDTSSPYIKAISNKLKSGNNMTVCSAVADAANKRKLAEMIVPFAEAANIDINNDGKKERVELVSDGTMHWEHLEVHREDGKQIELLKDTGDDWESDNLRWAMDQLLVKYEGKIYILGKTDEYLHYLSRVNKNNVESVVCEFSQRSKPVETVLTTKNDKLCQLALEQDLDYVEYDQPYNFSSDNVNRDEPFATTPTEFAAKVDINNDGVEDFVVGLEVASGAGRGCDAEYLGVLNKAHDQLDFQINQLLPKPVCGGVSQTPFVYEGHAYIEISFPSAYPSNNHQILQLKKDKLEIICQYDVRVVNYVLGEYERVLEGAKSAHVDPWVYALDAPGAGMGMLKILIDAQQDIRLQVRANTFGTALHEAIRRDRYDALTFLLENGANPNIQMSDRADMPVLIFAIWQNSIDGMKLLLSHGANPNQLWSGLSAKDWVNTWGKTEENRKIMINILSKN